MFKEGRKGAIDLWESVWRSGGHNASSSHGPHFISRINFENKKVLEVGCGDLMFARYDHLNMQYIGLDISGAALNEARINFHSGLFVQADAIAIPFKDRSFDVVFAIETVTCAGRDAYGMITEAGRVLTNNGTLLFDVVHKDIYKYHPEYNQYVEGICSMDHGALMRGKVTDTELIVYDEAGISDLLRNAGLEETEIRVLTEYEHRNMGVSAYQGSYMRPYDGVKSTIIVTATKRQ